MERAAAQLAIELNKTDIGQEILDVWEAIDPTGITGVVRAFNDPLCGGVPLPKL